MSESEEQQGPFPSSGYGLHLFTQRFEGQPAGSGLVERRSEKAWRASLGMLVRLSLEGSRNGLG